MKERRIGFLHSCLSDIEGDINFFHSCYMEIEGLVNNKFHQKDGEPHKFPHLKRGTKFWSEASLY
jgi:hypothetical protein